MFLIPPRCILQPYLWVFTFWLRSWIANQSLAPISTLLFIFEIQGHQSRWANVSTPSVRKQAGNEYSQSHQQAWRRGKKKSSTTVMVLFRPWRWWTLNYCAKGTVVVAQQLRRAMKIHNGLPLPCNRGGTRFLANTPNHKWIWREHFPFHFSVCKCTFHGSSRCFNKCVCGGGNPAQQTHHRGSRKGAGEGRIWGLGTSQSSENPCWARTCRVWTQAEHPLLHLLCASPWNTGTKLEKS